MAVGFNGTILTSTDGTLWTERNSTTTHQLRGVTWSGSRFVAVGNMGIILTSPDGTTWTKNGSVTVNQLMDVTWGDNQFVAVGYYNTIVGTIPSGILEVLIQPEEARDAGARWSVDGGNTWYNQGQQALPVGTYTITFSEVAGWNKPDDITGVTVQENKTATRTGTYNTAVLPGDVNGDGSINISDTILVLRHIVGLETLTGNGLIAADVNNDGQINVSDTIIILRIIVGLDPIL